MLYLTLVALCCIAILYGYIGYPILLVGLSPRLDSEDDVAAAETWNPSVAMIVPVYNEADVIVEKIRNTSNITYSGSFECIIVSDSNDRTDDLVKDHQDDNTRLIQLSTRRGKSHAINTAVEAVDTDVLVFSDANTMYEPDAVEKLVRPLSRSSVGCTTGQLKYHESSGSDGESVYWKYELFLRHLESHLGTTVSINGGMLAMRTSDFSPLPENSFTDDFILAMRQALAGRRIVYVPEAVGYESTADDLLDEYHRHVRIGVGNFQTLFSFWRLLDPRRGYLALQFFSHKVLRWIMPGVLLVVFIVTAIGMVSTDRLIFPILLGIQFVGYGVALAGVSNEWIRRFRLIRLVTYFVVMNVALGIGFHYYLRGPSIDIWK